MHISISAQGLNAAVQANITQTDLDAYSKQAFFPVWHLVPNKTTDYVKEASINSQGTLKLSIYNRKTDTFKSQVIGKELGGDIVFEGGPDGEKQFSIRTDEHGKVTLFEEDEEDDIDDEIDSYFNSLIELRETEKGRPAPRKLRGETPKAIKRSRKRKK